MSNASLLDRDAVSSAFFSVAGDHHGQSRQLGELRTEEGEKLGLELLLKQRQKQ